MVEMHLRLLRDECDRKTGIWDTVDEELTRLEKQVREEIIFLKRDQFSRRSVFLDQNLLQSGNQEHEAHKSTEQRQH